MRLSDLDPKLPPLLVRRVTDRSQEVGPGDLFLALKGRRFHGLRFAREVEARGAAAILFDPEGAPPVATAIPKIPYPGLTERLGELAARLYRFPSEELELIGITGTDGKTSCAYFLAQLLEGGYVGTLGWGRPGRLFPTGHTTPPPLQLQELLARFREMGGKRVVLEASSHALDQNRLLGCRFRAALWTNLGRDHLDYHGSLERYAEAKRRLLTWPGLEAAVLNADDPHLPRFREGIAARCFTFSLRREGGDLWPEAVRAGAEGLAFRLKTPFGEVPVRTPLFSTLHLPNLLATAAVALLWEPLEAIAARMASLCPPPGRMERFGGGALPLVVVDYAHTPLALERALLAARPHCRGKLWLVLGCGGERDRGKRPEMGAVARRLADLVVLTDDNPRGEDPEAIFRDILEGLPDPVARIHDRKEAIRYALERAGPGDLVLIAGKGHETYQEIEGRKVPFSDREVVLEWLRSR